MRGKFPLSVPIYIPLSLPTAIKLAGTNKKTSSVQF